MRLSLSLSQQTSPVFCLSFCRLLKLLQQTGVSSVPAGRDGFKVGNLSILQNTVQAGESLHICLTSSLDQFRKLSALPAWLPWLAWLVWRPPLLDVEWSIIFGLSDTGQLLSLELNITEDCQSLQLLLLLDMTWSPYYLRDEKCSTPFNENSLLKISGNWKKETSHSRTVEPSFCWYSSDKSKISFSRSLINNICSFTLVGNSH